MVSIGGCGASGNRVTSNAGTPVELAAGTLSDSAIEDLAATYETFAKTNATPYATRQHLGNPLANVYANAVAEST